MVLFVLPLQTTSLLPRSIARTASMGQISDQRGLVAAHLSWHAVRLVSELVAKKLLIQTLHIFLTLAGGETHGIDMALEVPTNSLKRIMAAVKRALRSLFHGGQRYRGCGIVAGKVSSAGVITADLFGLMHEDSRQQTLMVTVNQINEKYGACTLSVARVQTLRPKRSLPRFRYPLLIAH